MKGQIAGDCGGLRETKHPTIMSNIIFIVIFMLFYRVESAEDQLCFPKGFMFGVATAAFQVEGAWNVSGKGESIWDKYTHEHPERVFDHTNADIAADSYHQFKEDVRLVKELGVKYYRFSISWPRILPQGFSNHINKDGIRYYNELIDELLANSLYPLVTIYHWDLPQSLQELGGWTNPIVADYYVDYARVLFDTYGHKVGTWLTFNEPLSFCEGGYGDGEAPGHFASGVEDYMCAHNVLRAHGMVYRMYQKEYNQYYNGSIGIALDSAWLEPASTTPEDQEAAETARQFTFGWYAHPIFSLEGDYPPIMRKRIDEYSKHQNFSRSRLPTFTKEEVNMIKGSFDFMGFNHYTTALISSGDGKISPTPSFYNDIGVVMTLNPEWPTTNSTWLRVVPWGFRKAVNWIKNTYNNVPVVITENGVSFEPGLHDTRRVHYIDAYVRNLHAAIAKDSCQVVAYTYWSLIDNYEWMRGLSERFGLHQVDYTSKNRTRTPRLSAKYFRELATTGCIPESVD